MAATEAPLAPLILRESESNTAHVTRYGTGVGAELTLHPDITESLSFSVVITELFMLNH